MTETGNGRPTESKHLRPTLPTTQPESVDLDTSPIRELIRKTRLLLRSTWLATGAAICVGILLSVGAAATLADLAITLWPTFRLIAILLILVPAGGAFLFGVVKPLLRKLTSVLVARRIEREIPGIHNRLVSCVDLEHPNTKVVSEAFRRRLIREALDRIRGFQAIRVLDLQRLKRAYLFAFTSVAVCVVAFLLFSDRLPTAVARIFQPFADIPPASYVLFEVLVDDQRQPGDYAALRGAEIQFQVLARRGELPSADSHDALRLEIQLPQEDGSSKLLSYDFGEVDSGRTDVTLSGMQRSFIYRVYGAGTWTRQYQIEIIDRPEIVQLQAQLRYPDYLGISEVKQFPGHAPDIAGPKRSMVEFSVSVEGDAASGEIQFLQPKTDLVSVTDRPERSWFTEAHPEGGTAEGEWKTASDQAGRAAHFHPPAEAAASHGFVNVPLGFEVGAEEYLFAYVFLPEEKTPTALMLEWHNGQDWEHRAVWGEDQFGQGEAGTPARRLQGDLPGRGSWIRLEIAAEQVGLDAGRIHGLRFSTFGGECWWGAAGAVPAPHRKVTQLVPRESFRLNRSTEDPALWVGSLPLNQSGFYRVEMRNQLGYRSPAMEESRLTAIVDRPPRVTVERPGLDVIVSKPIKIPIYLSAQDDFGLESISLSVQKDETSGFQGRPLQEFKTPRRVATSALTLDLEAEGLQMGGTLRYRVTVSDRRKQHTTTRDYEIQMKEDPQAADQQFESFLEQTEQVEEQLSTLAEKQQEVTEMLEQAAVQFEPLVEKLEAADPEEAAPELTAEEQQQLAELKQQLAAAAQTEQQNQALGAEVAAALNKLAEQSPSQQLLAPEVGDQLDLLNDTFGQVAAQPLEQLAGELQQAAQADQPPPDVPQLQSESRQLGENLELLQERLELLSAAQRKSQEDAEQSVLDLRTSLQRQTAETVLEDLSEFQEYLAELRGQLSESRGDQESLIDDAAMDLSDRLFDKLVEEQESLEGEAESQLDEARNLLDQIRNAETPPPFVDEMESPESLRPAISDEVPEADPEFLGRLEQAAERLEASQPAQERRELQERQIDQATELDQAERVLRADEDALAELMAELQQAAEGESPEQAAMLAELLESNELLQAMNMFQMQQQQQNANPENPEMQLAAELPPDAANLLSNSEDVVGTVKEILIELDDLDFDARTVIMQMQPKEREQMLQGLREEGPEGYRQFVREYFRRLTKIPAASK